MAEILFDGISRILELLVETPSGESQRGQLKLAQIAREGDDFIFLGTSVISGQAHRFPLSKIQQIIDVETGENVDITEFRAELGSHPLFGRKGQLHKPQGGGGQS